MLYKALKFILLIINFKPVANIATFDMEFILNYTKYLKAIEVKGRNFESIVLIHSDGVELCEFEQRLQQEVQLPMLVANTKINEQMRIADFMSSNAIVLIFMSEITDKANEVAERLLRKRLDMPMIFAVQNETDIQSVRQFFKWCWQFNIIYNVLSVYIESESAWNIFTYTPFPKLNVLNVTAGKFENFIVEKVRNMHGYLFEFTTFAESPITYQLNGSDRVIGLVGNIFNEFVLRFNATYVAHKVPVTQNATGEIEKSIILAPSKKRAHISLNILPILPQYWKNTAASYPVLQTKLCLMLPVVAELPRRFYILHIFNAETWFAILGAFVILLLMLFLLKQVELVIFGHSKFKNAFLWTINILLNQPTYTPKRIPWKFRLIIAGSTLFSIVIVNCYTGSLTSAFSAILPGKQILTFQDFQASKLKILTSHHDYKLYVDSNILSKNLTPHIQITSRIDLVTNRYSLNNSFAYIVNSVTWRCHQYQQRHLTPPLFRTTPRLCSPSVPVSLPLQYDSPFKGYLTVFVMLLHEYGFIPKWKQDIKPLYYIPPYYRQFIKHPIALTLEDFRYAFHMYFIGIYICLIVFVVEYLRARWSFSLLCNYVSKAFHRGN